MKRIKFILLTFIALVLLIACEDGASIKVINQTNFNVYAEVDGNDFIVSGQSSYKVDVDTDEKVFLFDDGVTKKTLHLVGETFRIVDSYDNVVYDEVEIKVTPGETYNVYCKPRWASVKIINNSDYKITKLNYRKNSQFAPGAWFNIIFDTPLEFGDFAYYHLAYQTAENRFYYNFEVESGGEIIYSAGDEFQGIELSLDEQHLIVIENLE